MKKLLAEEKASTDDAVREEAFDEIQRIGAEDVPTIPIWQGIQVAGRARRGDGRRGDVRSVVHLPLLADRQES